MKVQLQNNWVEGQHARWPRLAIGFCIIIGSCVLLFTSLGKVALWEDEALTALIAQGVWRTGDTSAVVGHNIVAYRGGILLRGLYDRSTPPLPSYLASPFIGLLGASSWAARLPFAICGLLGVIAILRWLYRTSEPPAVWCVVGMAVLGNASLFLYLRQCRYYSPAVVSTIVAVYAYVHRGTLRYWRYEFVAASLVLLASNYLNFAALYACLAIDYVLWGRDQPLSREDWLWVVLPQALAGAALISVWNPAGRVALPDLVTPWWIKWIKRFWWGIRDLNACEMLNGTLVVGALYSYLRTRSSWLLRSLTGLMVYVAAIAIASPQPVNISIYSDVRFLAPATAFGIGIGVLALRTLFRRSHILMLGAGLIAFGTNLLNGAPFIGMPLRSTSLAYIRELIGGSQDPYTPVSKWIRSHVAKGQSVCVLPDSMTYPLMYLAPVPVYAWQLDGPNREIGPLNGIHYWARTEPDFIVGFGYYGTDVPTWLRSSDDSFPYLLVARIDVYCWELYRPELFLRSFSPITEFDRRTEAVYVFMYTGKRRRRRTASPDKQIGVAPVRNEAQGGGG